MRPWHWPPPIALAPAAPASVARIRRAKRFVFLRRMRHEWCSDAFQAAWAGIFRASPQGRPPVPPAQLALVTLWQAYTGASDDEAIAALRMDRRWPLVCDCRDGPAPPLGKATVVRCRAARIAHGLDRRLIERTIELAAREGGVGARPLRGALDSSPLGGAGRVEATDHLLGHALRQAWRVIARQQGRGLAAVAADAGAALVAGARLKAALDLDGDHPTAREQAWGAVLATLEAVEGWLTEQPGVSEAAAVPASMDAARPGRAQDVTVANDDAPALHRGVARARRISLEDPAMRQGRQSRRPRSDGDTRQVWQDLETGLGRAV